MEIFASDGTPFKVSKLWDVDWNQYRVRRKTKECKDFLMQRLFLVDLEGDVCILMGEPRLTLDKTALTSYNGCSEMWEGSRIHGHKGILISAYLFDGAVESAIGRRLRQRQKCLENMFVDEQPEDAVMLI